MRYLLIMSFAGTLLLLFYCLTHNKKVCLLPVNLQDILLKGATLCYLVPLVFLKPLYRELRPLFQNKTLPNTPDVMQYKYFYTLTEGSLKVSRAYAWQLGFFFLWLVVALTILDIRVFRHVKRKKSLLCTARPVKDGVAFELLEKIRQEQHIKKNIQLYDTQTSAFTMGVLQPVICFDSNVTVEQLELTLRHECMHIRRRDVFTGQLVQLAKLIHWFNPVVYLLPKKVERISEFCCDDAVIEMADELTRAEYAKMLVEQMVLQPSARVAHHALSENGEKVKERIQRIMKPKIKTKLQTAAAVAILSVVFFMDSWTAMAYPDVIEEEFTVPGTEFQADAEVFFVPDGAENPFDIEYSILYETQFVDEDGNIYPVQEEISTAAICLFHNWVSGQVQKHVVNDDGGCTIFIYEAEQCSKCGKVKQGDLINTQTNTVCPH